MKLMFALKGMRLMFGKSVVLTHVLLQVSFVMAFAQTPPSPRAVRVPARDFQAQAPTKNNTMKFAVVLDTASYQSWIKPKFGPQFSLPHNRAARLMAYNPPWDIQFRFLEALYDTGAEIIRIDPYFDPWLRASSPDPQERDWAKKFRDTLDRVVGKIRGDGKKLWIADVPAAYYANLGIPNHPLTWKEFRVAQKKQVSTLTRRYRPEYYEVPHEYKWYSDWGFISERPNADEWASQTEELCKIVKQINPATKVAIGLIAISPIDADVLKRVADSSCLDIIGVDIYYQRDLDAVKQNEFSTFVHQHGKEAWITEAGPGWFGSFGEPHLERSDAEWMRKLVDFARAEQMEGFIPFFSSHFFFYEMPPGWETVSQEKLDAIVTRFLDARLSERTAVFHAVRDGVQGKVGK